MTLFLRLKSLALRLIGRKDELLKVPRKLTVTEGVGEKVIIVGRELVPGKTDENGDPLFIPVTERVYFDPNQKPKRAKWVRLDGKGKP